MNEPTGLRSFLGSRNGAVLFVALVVWGLTLFDLILQPRVDTSYLPALSPKRLAGIDVTRGAMVVTSADPTSPAGPWVLTTRGHGVEVAGANFPNEYSPSRRTSRTFRVRLQTTVRNVERAKPFAVDGWNKREPALFTVSSPRWSPIVRVFSLRGENPALLESRVPLPRQTDDRRSFFVARWSGPRPDLFVVDRNANRHLPQHPPSLRPWSIRVYSGESRFKRLIMRTLLRPKLSRRLSKYDWWLDLATEPHKKPSLVLVTRARTTGSGRTEIHILSGQSRFHGFSLHAATVLPLRTSLVNQFVFQPERQGRTVLMVKVERGRLTITAIPLP